MPDNCLAHIHNYDLVPLITHLSPTVAIHTYLLHLQSLVALRTCLPRTSIELSLFLILLSRCQTAPPWRCCKNTYASTQAPFPQRSRTYTYLHACILIYLFATWARPSPAAGPRDRARSVPISMHGVRHTPAPRRQTGHGRRANTCMDLPRAAAQGPVYCPVARSVLPGERGGDPQLKGRDARQIGGGQYGMPICRWRRNWRGGGGPRLPWFPHEEAWGRVCAGPGGS